MKLQPHRFLTKRMNPSVMKTVNAIELLELVRQHGPVSRAELAKISHLSKPTVSDQVDFLISAGLVVNVGTGKAGSRGGKRPSLVQMNAGYGCILSVDIGPERIRFASSDLFGRTVRATERQTLPQKGARAVMGAIKRGLADLMARPEADSAKLRVISVAAPGIVDVEEGVVLETDNIFGWERMRLGPELKSAYGVDVLVDNDVNMAALAEMKSDAVGAPKNFVLIRANTGIGAAIVFDGNLYHGAHWAAGEVAHMSLDIHSSSAAPERRGYLESIVGRDRLAARLQASATVTAQRAVMEDVATHFSAAVANIAAVLDPEAIILMGEVFPPLLPRIQEAAARLVPWPVDVRLSLLGDDAALQGAVAAGLTRAYQQISWMLQSGGNGDVEYRAASGA